jgi:hypothetical protein
LSYSDDAGAGGAPVALLLLLIHTFLLLMLIPTFLLLVLFFYAGYSDDDSQRDDGPVTSLRSKRRDEGDFAEAQTSHSIRTSTSRVGVGSITCASKFLSSLSASQFMFCSFSIELDTVYGTVP